MGTVVLLNPVNFLDNLVVSFVPADALPFVLSTLTSTTQRILQAVRMINGLNHVQATHAKLTARKRRQRVTFNVNKLAVFVNGQKHAASIMATRG